MFISFFYRWHSQSFFTYCTGNCGAKLPVIWKGRGGGLILIMRLSTATRIWCLNKFFACLQAGDSHGKRQAFSLTGAVARSRMVASRVRKKQHIYVVQVHPGESTLDRERKVGLLESDDNTKVALGWAESQDTIDGWKVTLRPGRIGELELDMPSWDTAPEIRWERQQLATEVSRIQAL